jgi:hypothetical protein
LKRIRTCRSENTLKVFRRFVLPLFGAGVLIPFNGQLTEVFVGNDLENSSITMLSRKNGVILIVCNSKVFILNIFEIVRGKLLEFVERLFSD